MTKNYTRDKSTFALVLCECVTYANDSRDDSNDTTERYMKEIAHSINEAKYDSAAAWETLIKSDVFHDAVGKVVANCDEYVTINTEY